jgi:hypothetical protein
MFFCPLPHIVKVPAPVDRVEVWVRCGLFPVPPHLSEDRDVNSAHQLLANDVQAVCFKVLTYLSNRNAAGESWWWTHKHGISGSRRNSRMPLRREHDSSRSCNTRICEEDSDIDRISQRNQLVLKAITKQCRWCSPSTFAGNPPRYFSDTWT